MKWVTNLDALDAACKSTEMYVVLVWDQHPEQGPSFIYYLAVFKFAVVKVPEECSKVLCVLCSRKESL